MVLFPLLFSLIAAIVGFAGASYIISHYKSCYENREARAASAVGVTIFILFSIIFYGQNVLKGVTGEKVLGCTTIVIALLGVGIVYRILKEEKSST